MQSDDPMSREPEYGTPASVAVNATSGPGVPVDSALPRQCASDSPDPIDRPDNGVSTHLLSDDTADGSPDTLADDNSSIYGEEDAQSFIQPAISPMASRLSSPRTPAAEKAMAMDQRVSSTSGGGFFDAHKPPIASRLQEATPAPSLVPVVPAPVSKPTALSSVFQSGTRHGRSSSVGSDALRRLSKALPSLSFSSASSFLSSSSFFSYSGNNTGSGDASPSSLVSQKTSPRNSPTRATTPQASKSQLQSGLRPSHAPDSSPYSRRDITAVAPSTQASSPPVDPSDTADVSPLHRPPSVASRRSYVLRRSTSDDSLLYHTLSHVPSHGDAAEFEHIREQVNSRVKAIMDSFDRPTFKMPQLPSFFPDAKNNTTPLAREPLSPLDAALESLTGDVVVLGGYRGSILRSAEPPHRQLWVPVKVGLKIRKVNMEVGLDDEDEENMPQHIFPSGMLKHIGPVDISRRLFKKLRECENARKGLLRVHDYGYDWRLSPHRLSKQLIAFLEQLPSNRKVGPDGQRGAVVISHSLGGLITRHAVNKRPELFAGVIFAGTPQRCVNILGPLRNGDAVLLNEKVLTAQVNFSLRTTFAFLPEDGFCFVNSKDSTEEYPVDFYDVNEWIKYRWSPCVAPAALPSLQSGGISGVGCADNGEPQSKRTSTTNFGRALLEDLSGSLPSLPLRNRLHSTSLPPAFSAAPEPPGASPFLQEVDEGIATTRGPLQSACPPSPSSIDFQRARSIEYLTRTLANTKQFRAELAHKPEHTAANMYPPFAIIYGKGTPTVYAARVESRAAIASAEAYDGLVFRTGDGVVLSREATLPPGYHYVRDGYVSTDRGHVGMLGDLNAVGKALGAIIRGRQKGIGLGTRGFAGRATTAPTTVTAAVPSNLPAQKTPLLSAATAPAAPVGIPPTSNPEIELTS